MSVPAPISAVIMVGPGGASPQEQLVQEAQQASTRDLIGLLQGAGVAPIFVVSPSATWLPADEDGVVVEPDEAGQSFRFGPRLASIIKRHDLQTVLYFGGGSIPLLDGDTLALMIGILANAGSGGSIPAHIALTNNLHSSDWLAISRAGDALPIISGADRDNSLAWELDQGGQYHVRTITRMRPAVGFDLDTPADLALIRHHPEVKPALAEVLARHNTALAASPVQKIIDRARTDGSNLTLIGRVSPQAWQALNKVTLCWIRVFAEERGMVASGRLARGDVHTLIGALIRQQGPHAFFRTLAGMTDAAIIDTRPLIASQGIWPDDADRFASDLYQPEAINNPWLQEFTEAAQEASIPILLGGHSVVAGGLYALVEILEMLRQDEL